MVFVRLHESENILINKHGKSLIRKHCEATSYFYSLNMIKQAQITQTKIINYLFYKPLKLSVSTHLI